MTYEEVLLDMLDQQRKRKKNMVGTEKDLIQLWKKKYMQEGWNKYANFDARGKLNVPYALLKLKNLINDREEKYKKGRPIAPQTKHPMRRLFHMAGRAWAFIANSLEGEHAVIKHGGLVPEFFERYLVQTEHSNDKPLWRNIV